MTRPVILTAGKATRAGEYAPDGCKALVPLDGKPVIEWQLDVLGGDPIIVCRSEHAASLNRYGQVVVNDAGRGAADALASAVEVTDEPIVVAYADTFFDALPDGTDWVGVSQAEGGRSWYVLRDGYVAYEHVAAGWTAKVGVGLFAFSDTPRVKRILDVILRRAALGRSEVGLDRLLNTYQPWREVEIPSWRDVGSVEAIEAWSAA